MASINRSRNAEFADVADDDPFAELTRIVGNDARVLHGDRSHSANDLLGLDMENELLGNLSHFEQRRPEAPSDAPAGRQDAASPDELAESFSAADPAMEAEFEAAFEDEWGGEGDAVRLAGGQAADPEESSNLFDRISAELHTNASAYPVAPAVVGDDQARILSDEEITGFAAGWEERNQAPDNDAGVLPARGALSGAPFADDEQDIAESERPDLTHEDRPAEQGADAALLFADQADTAETPIDMPDLLLDSDLDIAFADGELLDSESEPEMSATDDTTFDYDKAAADRHDYLDHVFDDTRPETVQQAETEAESLLDADEAIAPRSDTDGPVRDDTAHGRDAAVPLWGRVRQEPSVPHEDVATAEPISPAGVDDAEDAAAAADPVALQDSERPYVETIDIEDRVAAVADDLGIPEPEPAPDPAADSEFDDLAAELAGAFGEMTDEPITTPNAGLDEKQQHSAAFVEEDRYRVDQADVAPASPAFEEQYQFETAIAGTGFDAPLDPEGREDANAWAGGMDEGHPAVAAPVRGRSPLLAGFGRRGMLGVAALAALVLIGGVSVFALTTGGGGLGQPALVKASDEPFKVKPKDPGGTAVSADNNEVYQRASGTVGAVPEQKALLKSAEEPIDLTKAVTPRIVDASAVRSALSDEPAATDAPEAKSEARLTPADDAQATDVPPALTVQARRVETFVVRPDGTLVPREPAKDDAENVASATPAGEAASESAADESAAPVAPVANAAPVADTGDDEDSAALASPAAPEPVKETATPAERPSEPAAPVAVASKAPTPAPATPKPALAAAATQAASDWSVQISSQPSADAAQESYRTMAQRYGDLLAGRGVNIVKADIAGKGTYYRVRIPSPSKDDAIDLCTKLKSAGGNCFVSK